MSKDALIIGAGIGGLTAVHALRQQGWTCQIHEQASEFSEVGAGIQLSPNATRILQRLNLLDAIRARSFEPEAATIRHGPTGRTCMYAPLKGFCERTYGAPYLHIYRPDLHAILAEGLEVELGSRVESYDPGSFTIGADGLRSSLQMQMNGPEAPSFTGQVAWRGLVQADESLRALIPPHASVWAGPGQHVVTYYLRPDLINFVAVTEQSDWQEEGWNLPGDVAELRDRFAGWHPAVTQLLSACQAVQRWALFDRQPLPKWVEGQVALLGDAAHPTLPFLAQGAALAIEDAWALAKFAPDLEAYERARKPRTSKLQAWARSNANLYHQTRWLDRVKLLISSGAFRGPQAHILFWQIFSYSE